METICSWILNKIHFLKYKLVGLPDPEPSLPPPWALESPFQKWTVYSKASLAASVICFTIFLILLLRKRTAVPTKTVVRRISVPLIKEVALLEYSLLYAWVYSLALLLILCLFLSIPWEWVRLYQIEVAKKASVLSEGYARSCYQADLSFWEMLKVWFSWNFSWDSGSCESYYKALMVDPFWEVTPLMAISSVIGRLIIHPLELFSHTIGRSLRNIMKEIPSQWQLPVFLLFPLIFISMLVPAYTRRKDIPVASCHRAELNTRSRITRGSLRCRT